MSKQFMTPEDVVIQELRAQVEVMTKALQHIAKKPKTMDEAYNGDRLRIIAREVLDKYKKVK